MRISYWSSDVCSSDLHPALEGFHARECMLDESCYVLMTNDRIFSDRPRFLQSVARFKKNARCGFSLAAIATARHKSARLCRLNSQRHESPHPARRRQNEDRQEIGRAHV